jgi:hypothetical protein
MDSITPDVDGFCWTVAKNVNSLLFRNNWINFSLTWGAAWISLSLSRSQERRAGGTRVRKRREEEKRQRRNTEEEREKGIWEGIEERSQLKCCVQGSTLHFSFPLPVNSFHFQVPLTTPYSHIHSMKNPEMLSLVTLPTCHFDKFTIDQRVIFWHEFWRDTEQFGLLQTD